MMKQIAYVLRAKKGTTDTSCRKNEWAASSHKIVRVLQEESRQGERPDV